MTDVPKSATRPIEEIDELSQVAQKLPQETEVPEAIPYIISFAKYNKRMCEISELSKNKAKKALEIFKIVGTKICCEADYRKHCVSWESVRYEGEYKKLYSGLSEDVELKEIKLQDTARIFYFDIEPKREFYVVAVRENHLETKKVRR